MRRRWRKRKKRREIEKIFSKFEIFLSLLSDVSQWDFAGKMDRRPTLVFLLLLAPAAPPLDCQIDSDIVGKTRGWSEHRFRFRFRQIHTHTHKT